MPLTERDVNRPLQGGRDGTATPPSLSKATSKPPSRLPVPLLTTPKTSSPPAAWQRADSDRSSQSLNSAARAQRLANNRLKSASPEVRHPAIAGAAAYSFVPQNSAPASMNKPLPADKPLPSKPVARLSTTPSPSKLSRSLMDAAEKPLHMTSSTGAKHEWPSLKPQPRGLNSSLPSVASSHMLISAANISTPSLPSAANLPSTENIERTASSSTRYAQASTTDGSNDAVGNEKPQRASGYPIAPGSPPASSSRTSIPSINKNAHNTSSSTSELYIANPNTKQRSRSADTQGSELDFPTRQMSLRNRISNGSLVTRGTGSAQKITAFTDYTRSAASSPSLEDSRKHSPSPANFSRPRPGSIGSPTADTRVKTASRIPLPDNKSARPTMVNVGENRLSVISTSTSQNDSSSGPSYGSRRLDAPNALQILDQGTRRRQMQRNLTASNPQLRHAPTLESMRSAGGFVPPPRSLTSSSNRTCDPYSAEETTLSPSMSEEEDGVDHHAQEKQPHAQETVAQSTVRMISPFDEDENQIPSYYYRGDGSTLRDTRPPPTSPFTTPLPTIPSEAAIDVNLASPDEKVYVAVSSALSQLEGRSAPPHPVDVDENTLIRMFGRLKPSLSKNEPSSLSDNAAAAEKYLAMRDSDLHSGSRGSAAVSAVCNDDTACDLSRNTSGNGHTASDAKQGNFSKWSCTTPSEHTLSPASADLLSVPRREDQPQLSNSLDSVPEDPLLPHQTGSTGSRLTVQKAGNKPLPVRNASMNYPSRIPMGNRNQPQIPSSSSAIHLPKRQSSPTLGGKRPPGSVRAARETMQNALAGYARSTASTDFKKASKSSRSNVKAPAIPESPRPGLKSTPRQSETSIKKDVSASKLERSRSKSRYVLSKINGLLPGRREKKSSIPPVPSVDKEHLQNNIRDSNGPHYPPHRAVRVPTAQKLPSLSPTIHSPLRPPSTATTPTDDGSLIDGLTSPAEPSSHSVQTLAENLVDKARHEVDLSRKERLLSFAKVLTDSLISVREAHISAETAKQAANNAQMAFEMTQRGLVLLQKLAASLDRNYSAGERR